MKTVFAELWARIVLSYKSTLIGLAIGVGILALEQFSTYFASLTTGWAKVAAAVVAIALALLKSKQVTTPPAS